MIAYPGFNDGGSAGHRAWDFENTTKLSYCARVKRRVPHLQQASTHASCRLNKCHEVSHLISLANLYSNEGYMEFWNDMPPTHMNESPGGICPQHNVRSSTQAEMGGHKGKEHTKSRDNP